MESSARNEPLPSFDESNESAKTSEEGDTREIDVGTERVIASRGSSKGDAVEKKNDHKLASPDKEKSLVDKSDVGEDAIPLPKPSRTQQATPDASSDARLDVDVGSMTAQKWSQEQLQELGQYPLCFLFLFFAPFFRKAWAFFW